MQRNTIASLVFATLIIGSVPALALAGGQHGDGHGRGHDTHAMRGVARDVLRNATPEERAVLKDLRRIDALYRREGLTGELPALYTDVLARTQNVAVTTVANARLQQLQTPKQDSAVTIATLRERLDGNLASLK